jgi:hypothetical protein
MSGNYFISGLPRSGSTLLCNILKQNPALSNFTKGRQWGTDKSLPDLFQIDKPKILVTYRPILEVLASFVKLAEQYPQVNFIDKLMLEEEFPPLYYRPPNDARCDWLMRPSGAIESNNSVFKNMAVYGEWFHLVTYEDLSINPKETIAQVYDFLEIEHYEHDLENIPQSNNSEDEEEFGIPTLHTIRPQISKSSANPKEVLSDYVIQKYSNAMDFFTKGWLQSQP